jgi:hypothetical protein
MPDGSCACPSPTSRVIIMTASPAVARREIARMALVSSPSSMTLPPTGQPPGNTGPFPPGVPQGGPGCSSGPCCPPPRQLSGDGLRQPETMMTARAIHNICGGTTTGPLTDYPTTVTSFTSAYDDARAFGRHTRLTATGVSPGAPFTVSLTSATRILSFGVVVSIGFPDTAAPSEVSLTFRRAILRQFDFNFAAGPGAGAYLVTPSDRRVSAVLYPFVGPRQVNVVDYSPFIIDALNPLDLELAGASVGVSMTLTSVPTDDTWAPFVFGGIAS